MEKFIKDNLLYLLIVIIVLGAGIYFVFTLGSQAVDNFSEINQSSTSIKNTAKKQENKEIKYQESNKKEIPDKILNKSLQKNQENFWWYMQYKIFRRRRK